MTTALWAGILGVAVLWPARLAGPLDGVPLDTAAEAILLGVVLSFLLWTTPQVLRQRAFRAVTIALLLWKAVTAATLVQDGWCLRFESPVPLYRDMGGIPHSWDIRADWRSPVPRCSAIMTRGYDRFESFPAWFYNLPPVSIGEPAIASDRPPLVNLKLYLEGFLRVDAPGTLQLNTSRDVTFRIRVDGIDKTPVSSGVEIAPGSHHISIEAELVKGDWVLMPMWNGRDLWSAAVATLSPTVLMGDPGIGARQDLWLRPWGRFVPAMLIAILLALAATALARRAASPATLALAAALAATFSIAALSGRAPLMRAAPLLLLAPAVVRLPRRVKNLFGACLLIGLPFLALFATLGAPQAGRFMLYTSGDDWWMFQRYAYRIFMQGYWLEGGEPTFWFQPLYRWIAGSLHMVFGDSSVGEVFWDAACALAGALFAFRVTRVIAGFRWAVSAAALVLAMMTLGPAWYLFGRGLSEISSMGFIYAGALFAMRGRHGSWPHILMAGTMALLAFFTRLNNLPIALAVALFAWPSHQPIADLFRPRRLVAGVSVTTLAGIITVIVVGLVLFTARTWYYTGEVNMLFGTQAGALRGWQTTTEGLSPIENLAGSILSVLTMNDPPRLDLRAVPLVAGVVSALFGVAGVRPFSRLPLGLVGLCLAGMSGALVARGSAYPGRFSVHLIPAAVALATCACAFLISSRLPRSLPPAPRSPDTT